MTASASSPAAPFDAIVIGTGFAGAVTACRLVEAGLRICVLERGRRYGPGDFPNYPSENLFESQDPHAPPTDAAFPDFSRWLWSQDHGLYDVRDLKDTLSVQAAGYGGGSLIYANVHMRPPRAVFDTEWPPEYRGGNLDSYFDLAAYMLQAEPVPQRLAKSLQLKRAGDAIGAMGGTTSWFRTPLAVNFVGGRNPFGRDQQPCDMRARCWRGCDRQAKNTLDVNYLARAEDGTPAPDIRTLAEVTRIERSDDGRFTVFYRDLWRRPSDDDQPLERYEHAPYVFLCAGSLNTTELLFKSRRLLSHKKAVKQLRVKLGSRYFPNADGLAAVFDCDEPHEADFGPTITSALLHSRDAQDGIRAVEFDQGRLLGEADARRNKKRTIPLARGMRVTIGAATATLVAAPMLDWGDWTGKTRAVGTLVLENLDGHFTSGDRVEIGGLVGAMVTRPLAPRTHWFLVEDGGYPPDLEAMVGVFRSPLWLRRNRYFEPDAPPAPGATLRRPATRRLRVDALTEALGGTSTRSFSSTGLVARSFSPDLSRQTTPVGTPAADFFPNWLADAAKDTRQEFFGYATAMALPFLGRLLDEMSSGVATKIDPATVKRLSGESINSRQLEFLVRGMLRQAIQILAGSEVEVAAKVARILLKDVPGSLEDVMRLAGDVLLWALGYGSNDRRTGLLLIMGRDLYRGRLICEKVDGRRELRAQLPSPLVDSLSGVQERILRDIARRAWNGELRTNPGWTTLGKRVTVHSQGGCPMGAPETSVTNPDGVVHGCPGLYVMDAAAFPVSVGVNPSATITAIAEFKVERFLTTEWSRRDPGIARWKAYDHADAAMWWSGRDRGELDPLNRTDLVSVDGPASGVVGLEFDENMRGFVATAKTKADQPLIPDPGDDARLPTSTTLFVEAESDGIKRGQAIALNLRATVLDLARLIATTAEKDPAAIGLAGTIVVDQPGAKEPSRFTIDATKSYLRAFVHSRSPIPTRYFRYHLEFEVLGRPLVFEGVKILRDAPGFDVWIDTSTLFFEIREPHAGDPIQRGVARVSLDLFMREQLPSMTVTGTTDPIRRSWALAAYYKHFAGELAAVYGKRAQQFTDMLLKLVAGIHV